MAKVIEIVVAGPQGKQGEDAVPAGAILHLGDFDASAGMAPIAPVLNSAMYTVSVYGVIDGEEFNVGDHLLYSLVSSKWERVLGENAVSRVTVKQVR